MESRFRIYGRLIAAGLVVVLMGYFIFAVRVPDVRTETPPPATPNAPVPAPPTVDLETEDLAPGETIPTDAVPTRPPPSTSRPRLEAAGPLDLVMPVAGIRPDELVDTFDQARSAGRSHDAIDIIAPRGTPVLAAGDGEIVRLFTSERGGLTIYQLAPDDQTVYYYAHLDRYADGLDAGQSIRAGDVVGYVGDTGNAVPGNYHLHFAVWVTDDPKNFWDGESVNPYPLLAEEE